MADAAAKRVVEEAVAAECEACGARFRARAWREGMQCPKCQSGRVNPLVAPGGAVDYCVADRSDGYAPADVRFAQWAKWTGLITPSQYERAFIHQNRQIQEGASPDPIHEIMVLQDWIAREQAIGLLEFMALPRPNERDGQFVRLLEHNTDVDMDKVRRLQRLQAKAATRRHEVPPLCQLLMEKRIISEAQLLAILKHQAEGDAGDLARARSMAGEARSVERTEKLRKTLSLKNPRTRQILIVTFLLVMGLVAWRWQVGGGRTMFVKCRRCDEVAEVKWSRSFPVKCPEGHRDAYYAMICQKGHIFTVENPFKRHVTCPECGTTNVRPLREEDLP
jgi:hypothetical protein